MSCFLHTQWNKHKNEEEREKSQRNKHESVHKSYVQKQQR